MAKPTYQVEIDTMTVEPGETLTVYIRDFDGNLMQVEIQSYRPAGGTKGTPKIFCDGPIEIQSFDDWCDNCIRPARRGR